MDLSGNQKDQQGGGEKGASEVSSTTNAGMNSSLDEILQPKFYESEDSSSNKTDPKHISTSQILDDLDMDLPHDSLDTTYTKYEVHSTTTTTTESRRSNDSSPGKGEGISAMKSPFDLGPDDDNDSLEESLPPNVQHTSTHVVRTEFTSSKPMDLQDDFGFGIPHSKPMEFTDIYEEEKYPSPIPSSQLQGHENVLSSQLDQKHSEISSMLHESAQDLPPSPNFGFGRPDSAELDKPVFRQEQKDHGFGAVEQESPFHSGDVYGKDTYLESHAMKTPYDFSADDNNFSLQETLQPINAPKGGEMFQTQAEPSQLSSFKPADFQSDFGMGLPTSQPTEHKGMFEEDKNPSPIPGYQLEGDSSDDVLLSQFDQKHSELSSFLQGSTQEFPPSPSPQSDIDRSDNSGIQELGKSKPQEQKGQDFKSSYAEPSYDSGDFYGKSTYVESQVPPPIPSHKAGFDSSPAFTSSFEQREKSKTPEIAVCPQPPIQVETFSTTPKAASKVEEKPKVTPKEAIDELADFLPNESFETIPPKYSATTISPPEKKKEEERKVEQKMEKKKTVEPASFEVSEEVQQILNILNPVAWFDPNKLHPTVSELVYWRDPKKSGAVFGSIFVILIALVFFSFISVFAYASLALLTGTFAFRIYKNILQAVQKTNDGHPFKEYLESDLSLQSDKSEEVYKAVINYLNSGVNRLRHLFLVEDVVDSAKFGVVLYMLTYLGSWFNGLTLLIIAFIALFALPKVYESNKTIIDQYVDLAWAKISEVNSKVSAAIPWGKKEKAQ